MVGPGEVGREREGTVSVSVYVRTIRGFTQSIVSIKHNQVHLLKMAKCNYYIQSSLQNARARNKVLKSTLL